MKKILIFEYITGGGLLGTDFNSKLFIEAELIIKALFSHKNYNIKFFSDYRSKLSNHKNSIVLDEKNIDLIFDINFIKEFDYFIPICPETNLSMYNYVKTVYKDLNNILASDPLTIQQTSDKREFYRICSKNKILNPDNFKNKTKNKKYLLKDRYGCGCSMVEILDIKKDFDHNTTILNNYIDGTSYSLSIFVKRNKYKVMSVNKQNIRKSNNKITLDSLEVNIYPPFTDSLYEFIDSILTVFPGLYGFIGLDIILNDENIYLIEINPRFTTSMTLIQLCKDNHPLDYISNDYIDKVGRVSGIKL